MSLFSILLLKKYLFSSFCQTSFFKFTNLEENLLTLTTKGNDLIFFGEQQQQNEDKLTRCKNSHKQGQGALSYVINEYSTSFMTLQQTCFCT